MIGLAKIHTIHERWQPMILTSKLENLESRIPREFLRVCFLSIKKIQDRFNQCQKWRSTFETTILWEINMWSTVNLKKKHFEGAYKQLTFWGANKQPKKKSFENRLTKKWLKHSNEKCIVGKLLYFNKSLLYLLIN